MREKSLEKRSMDKKKTLQVLLEKRLSKYPGSKKLLFNTSAVLLLSGQCRSASLCPLHVLECKSVSIFTLCVCVSA